MLNGNELFTRLWHEIDVSEGVYGRDDISCGGSFMGTTGIAGA